MSQYRSFLRALGAPEDPVATDTSSAWSLISLWKALFQQLTLGNLIGRSAGSNYTFDSGTSAADPGVGKLRLNHATPSSATALYINETDVDGNGVAADLATWDDSSSTVKGRLKIFNPTDPSAFAIFTISGTITDNGAWNTFTISHVASAGTFANGQTVAVVFSPKGDIGATGASGATGGTGATGPQGDPGEGLVDGVLELPEQGSDPATPSAGALKVYAKTDKKVYRRDSDGNVSEIGTGGGGSSDSRLGAARLSSQSAQRHVVVNGFADAFAAAAGIDAGDSSNYIHDGQVDEVTNEVVKETLSNTLDTDNAGWDGRNIRQWFAAALFSASGVKVRLYFEAPASGYQRWNNIYVGHAAASGDAFDWAAAPVQVKFGDGTWSWWQASDGDVVRSDLVDFAYDETKPLLVAWYPQSGSDTTRKKSGLGANYNAYYKSAASETSTVDVTGYTAQSGHLHSLAAVEILGPASMVLVLTPRTLPSEPSTGHIQLHADIGAATLNTDVIAELSRDGGTTWTAGTLVEVGTLEDGTKLYEATDVDLTGQPSGQSLTARIRTPNSDAVTIKRVTVEGVA